MDTGVDRILYNDSFHPLMSEKIAETKKHSHGWLDRLAISMAVVCAIHCLIVPVLIVSVPLIQTTFFVDKDFHLWMLLAVFPTTLASIMIGCKKHRDRWVGGACLLGLSLLLIAFFVEQRSRTEVLASASIEHAHTEHCLSCSVIESPLSSVAWINTLGGLFLIIAHSRNFYLCRKHACGHGICQNPDCGSEGG